MPIAAKFSKRFYDQLGHDIADELVNWINDVDAGYRGDLRELNELNFARFDAKVEQRFAEQDAKIEKRLAELETKFEKRFAEFDVKMEARFAQVEIRFERALKDQMRWMFGVWASLLIAIIGLWMRG